MAEQLDLLTRTNALLARELGEINAEGRVLSQAAVLRLEQVVRRMRPAFAAREELGNLDQQLLLAGVREWQRRRAGDSE